MITSLFGVSSQEYIRLLESGSLEFFSQLTCFQCASRLWRNGFRQRRLPQPIKLLRLKCSNPLCKENYTVYPADILPSHRYHLETVLTLTSTCLKASSNQESALTSYQHSREMLIEDGKVAGPDVSTLRRWLKKLSDPISLLCLFLSACRKVIQSKNGMIKAIQLTSSLAFQLLTPPMTMHAQFSPRVPVTCDSNQGNGGVVSQNDPIFYTQEHSP